MKNIYCIIICVFSLSLSAQPVISANVFFDVGDSVRVHQSTNFNFMPGPAGPNQNWDFSNLSTDNSWVWRSGMPDTTPYFNHFPTANQMFNTYFDGDSVGNYIYYKRNPNSYDLLGTAGEFNGDTVVITYDIDPKTLGPFPLSYNWVSSDFYKGDYTISVQGFTIPVVTTGQVWDTADAYGTITTPFGTFTNVLRVKSIETVTDSSTAMGITSATTQQKERYHWYAPNEKYLILEIEETTTIPPQGPSFTSQIAQWRVRDFKISAEEVELAQKIGLEVFPNPSSDWVNIIVDESLHGSSHIYLQNVAGQKLIHKKASNLNPGNAVGLDVSGLGSGTYLLVVETDQKRASKLVQITRD